MKIGSIHNHHMTVVEGYGTDFFAVKFNRGPSYVQGAKWPTDYLGIPHIKDSVFVGILPENVDEVKDEKFKKGVVISMPQDEQFIISDSTFVNMRKVPIFMDCTGCWSKVKWRQGAHTYRFSGLSFVNSSKRIFVLKKGIFWDLDGTLTGTPNSYTTWADKHLLGMPTCSVTEAAKGVSVGSRWDPVGGLGTEGTDSGGVDPNDSIFHVVPALIHSRRDFSFVTCTTPIRKMNVAYAEPAEIVLRQLNVTNKETGFTHVHEYEEREVFGWGFPVLSNSKLEIRPNFPGLDLSEAALNFGFSDLFAFKEADALQRREAVQTEWLSLTVASWSKWNHYRVITPDWEHTSVRRGQDAGMVVKDNAKMKDPLPSPGPLSTPQNLPSMSHAMTDGEHWTVVFKHPLPADAPSWEQEPHSLRFEARRCPDVGCTKGLGWVRRVGNGRLGC